MFRTKGSNAITAKHSFRTASLFLVFAILCNICYIPCYAYIRNLHRERILTQHEYTLEHGMQLLDASIESISTAISINNEQIQRLATAYSREDIDDLELKSIQQFFSSYFLPFEFITEVGITNNEELLLDRDRIYFTREYLNYPYYWTCSRENYFDEFTGLYCILSPAHFITPDYGEYDALTIGCRLSKAESLYLFVHYPCDHLYELFSTTDALKDCPILVYHGDDLLCSSLPILERDYELLSIESSNGLGLRVEMQLPNRYIEQDLAPLQNLVTVFVGIVCFACLVWISLFSYAFSRPFVRIANAVLSAGHFSDENKRLSSTEFLVQSIQLLGAKISNSTEMLNSMRERNKIHVLERALNRGLYSDEAKIDFEIAFPNFPVKWQLALIQFSSESEDIQPDAIQASILQYFESKLPSVLHVPFTRNSILILFSREPDDCPKQILNDLCLLYQEEFSIYISYTLGRIYSDPLFLADAAQQIEYAAIISQSEGAVCSTRKSPPISIQRLHTMYGALQARDEKAAITILNTCISPILSNNDYIAAKHAQRAISLVLIQLKRENACLAPLVIPTFRRDKIRELFVNEFPAAFRQTVEILEENSAMQSQSLDEQILAFIEQNIGNQQLSVNSVTDKFNISAPTLQKRLTACVGQTFSAYVEGIRLKKARQALLDTDLSIQAIAESSGYANSNSFYKAYKRFYGESPRSTRQNQDI